MKAIVVELKNDFAVVLSEDGCISTVKDKKYKVGQSIQLNKTGAHLYQLHKKICVFAASAAAASILLATGTWAYASPYAYVSLDVNPSIEYTVNRFDRVLRIKAMNEDGKELLNGTDFVNKSISAAFSSTIEQLTNAGYLNDEAENGIVIATSSENEEKAEELAADLKEIAVKYVNKDGNGTEIEAFRVDSSLVNEAKELGVTPGKLNLIEKLIDVADSSDSVNVEEWLEKSVKEIKKATKAYKAIGEKEQPSAKANNTYTEDENSSSETTVEEDNTSKNHNPNDSRADNNHSGNSDKKVDSRNQNHAERKEPKVKKQENTPDNSDEHNDRASQVDDINSVNDASLNNSSSNHSSTRNSSMGNINNNSMNDNDKSPDNDDASAQEITEILPTVTCEPSADSGAADGERIDKADDKSKDSKVSEIKNNDPQSADTGNADGGSEKNDHKNSDK